MISWETSISLASAIVAACAFGITVWQACLTRKHNKLSVRPMLTTFQAEDEKDNTYYSKIYLENCGVGPAIIKNFILLEGDQEVSRNNFRKNQEYIKQRIPAAENLYIGFCVPGYVLSAGTKHTLLEIVTKTAQDIAAIEKLNLIVEYQCIYQEEVFTYDSRNDRIYHGREDKNE